MVAHLDQLGPLNAVTAQADAVGNSRQGLKFKAEADEMKSTTSGAV